MNMYQIVVFSKDSQATMLWFKTKEMADLVSEKITGFLKGVSPGLKVEDDFGATLILPRENISHVVFNDMSKQAELYKMLEGIGYVKKG